VELTKVEKNSIPKSRKLSFQSKKNLYFICISYKVTSISKRDLFQNVYIFDAMYLDSFEREGKGAFD